MYFGSLHFLKQAIRLVGHFGFVHIMFFERLSCSDRQGRVGPAQALLVGAMARSIAAATFLPVTVVKTRYEV